MKKDQQPTTHQVTGKANRRAKQSGGGSKILWACKLTNEDRASLISALNK